MTGRRPTVRACLVAVMVVMVLVGDVLAFNQLATQSPTDAIVPVIVLVIGGGGVLEGLRRVLVPRTSESRSSAVVPGMCGVAALVTWRLQAPVGWSVILTIVAAVFVGTLALQDLRGNGAGDDESGDARQVRGLLCLAQTLVLVSVASLAAADAGSTLFG